MQGGAGTVYEGLTYRLSFKFTSEYPVGGGARRLLAA